jgi:hypothetical protein
MKLRLTLTYSELLGLLSNQLGTTIDEVNIIVSADLVNKLKGAVEKYRFTSDQKIMAIKELREATREGESIMRLADAKWAVENWGDFISFVSKNARLPKEDYYYGLK